MILKNKLFILLMIFSLLLVSFASADTLYYLNNFDLPQTVKSLEYIDVGIYEGYVISNATSYTCFLNISLTQYSCNSNQQLTMTDHSFYNAKFAHVRITDDLIYSADLSGAGTGSYGTGGTVKNFIVFENNGTLYSANQTHFREYPLGNNISFPPEMRNNIYKCDYYDGTIACLGSSDLRTVYQINLSGTLLNAFRLESSGTLANTPIDITGVGEVLEIVTANKIYMYAISNVIDVDLTQETNLLDGDLSPQQKILATIIVAIIIMLTFTIIGYTEGLFVIFSFIGSALTIGWLITAVIIGWVPAWIIILMFILASGIIAIAIRKAVTGG